MACPNGTGWCKGHTGPSNATKCSACQAEDKAAAGASAPVAAAAPVAPLPAALAAIALTATPREVLAGRGSTGTTVHLGVGEQVDLAHGAAPAGYAFSWSKSGEAQITDLTTTGAVLTAGTTAGEVTVKLKVASGPSHVGHVLATRAFKVIAPSGTTTMKATTDPGLRHATGTAGVGFKMWIKLLPATVVFSRVEWREHTGHGVGTGHFSANENGRNHAPTGVGYGADSQPLNTMSATWMGVNGPAAAPYGVNFVLQIDTVDTGDHPPVSPGIWKASSHKWNIEWRYRVKKADGTYGPDTLLERAMHQATIDTAGKATISKAGAGPFSKDAADPTSTC